MFPIKCPYCNDSIPTENISQARKTSEARGFCSQCKRWFSVLLPSIRKKLIYLDQSFLSAACLEADNHNSQSEVRIIAKLRELKVQQSVFVIVSEIHSRETSAIPSKYEGKRDKLWKFQNGLADGSVAYDWDEIFVAQWRRILADRSNSNSFSVADIGPNDPHQHQIGVSIHPTNLGIQKLYRENGVPRDTYNVEFRSIFNRQLENMPNCKDTRDCLSYVRELWRKDIQRGITSCQQQRDLYRKAEQIIKELDAGRIPDIPTVESSPFCRVVGEVVQGLGEESMLRQWLKLLESDSANLCAYVRIRSSFEAVLLWKWKEKGAFINPKKFHAKFGLSCQNDIDHISTFAPYVDVLTTDDKMRVLSENAIVAAELRQFPCKIFSKNNYDEFETWLDTLLAEPPQYQPNSN